jgi:hypothetical protein
VDRGSVPGYQVNFFSLSADTFTRLAFSSMMMEPPTALSLLRLPYKLCRQSLWKMHRPLDIYLRSPNYFVLLPTSGAISGLARAEFMLIRAWEFGQFDSTNAETAERFSQGTRRPQRSIFLESVRPLCLQQPGVSRSYPAPDVNCLHDADVTTNKAVHIWSMSPTCRDVC